MKSYILMSLACLAVMLGFTDPLLAQKQLQDSLRVFEEPLQLESGGRDLIGYSKEQFELLKPSNAQRISSAEAKALNLPRNTRRVSTTILRSHKHQHSGMCWQISCSSKCSRCFMIWLDRDGDGKVKPTSELRCVDLQGNTVPLRIKRIQCE